MRTVKATAVFGALLGVFLGYQGAGVGGSILFAALLAVGGFLVGAAVEAAFLLLGHFVLRGPFLPAQLWRVLLAVCALVVLVVVTWGVRF